MQQSCTDVKLGHPIQGRCITGLLFFHPCPALQKGQVHLPYIEPCSLYSLIGCSVTTCNSNPSELLGRCVENALSELPLDIFSLEPCLKPQTVNSNRTKRLVLTSLA